MNEPTDPMAEISPRISVRFVADTARAQAAMASMSAVQDIAIEADFGKHLLYVRNKDKPGFIGAIGTVLGSAGINIATFHLGRTAPGKDALCLIEVDQAIPEGVLEKVKGLSQVERVRTLSF